ncbi:hypothetical protein RB594_006074 [Gaeumannomyces avenae]
MTSNDDSVSREPSPVPSEAPAPPTQSPEEVRAEEVPDQEGQARPSGPQEARAAQKAQDSDDLPDYESEEEEAPAPEPATPAPPPPTAEEAQWQVALSEADVFLDLMSDILLFGPAPPATGGEENNDDDDDASGGDSSGAEESAAHGSETEADPEADSESEREG